MAALEHPMAQQVRPTLPNWRSDDARNIRSNAKAERVLGLSEITGPFEQGRRRLIFNFSFPDLRDVIPALSKKASRHNFGVKASDSESIVSNPSPTFDPSASSTSLNTVDSTPATNKRRHERPQVNNAAERFSQAETLRTNRAYAPSEEDTHHLKMLTSMGITGITQPEVEIVSLGRRKRSIASLTSFRSEATIKANQQDRRPSEIETSDIPPLPVIAGTALVGNSVQNHARNRSENIDSANRYQRVPRSSSLPSQRVFTVAMSSTGTEAEQVIIETAEEVKPAQAMPLQWPLPATRIPSPPKLRRINNSNLLDESVLLWSSDEDDSDTEKPKRRSFRTSSRWSRQSYTNPVEKAGHQRQESNASSVIQLDSRPWIRPASSFPSRTFPKRSLADIAAAGAYRPESCDSWETDVVGDLGPQTIVMDERKSLDNSQTCLDSEMETRTHPLWRASTSSGDIDIRIPRSRTTLELLPEVDTTRLSNSPDGDGGLDFSSFPVPPRSRAGSILPSIQVHNPEDDQTTAKTAMESYPAIDEVLLSPTMKSKFSSDPHISGSSDGFATQPVEPIPSMPKRDTVLAIMNRKRTVSNVPIYVTGLETSMNNDDAIEGDVKSYVFASMF